MNTQLKKLIVEFVGVLCLVAALFVIPLAYRDIYKHLHGEISTSISLVFWYAELITIIGAYLCYKHYDTIK